MPEPLGPETEQGLAGWEHAPPRLQLAVLYPDHTTMYYRISAATGWKIDGPSRCLIIGTGVPRTYVPLDNIRSFEIVPVAPVANA